MPKLTELFMDFKSAIIKKITFKKVSKKVLSELITLPSDKSMGDFCLPCFSLAKILKKSPQEIATEIKNSILYDGLIEQTEVVNGYLNFYLSKNNVTKSIIEELLSVGFEAEKKNNKTMCIDYSSVNLAKYMHIGHWATTIIGESIARLYENQGFKVYRLNYIGDYGTTFGKMVYAYLKWGNEKDVEERGIDAIQDLYVEFCKQENEELLEKARETSKKIENGDREIYSIYEWFVDISKKEAKRLLDRAEIYFDSWKGESFYNDKMDDVIEELKKSGLAKVSEGALVVDLSEYNLGMSVIQRGDGASLYVTRDLAALKDRYAEYEFDEMIYVTAVQQNNHFEKLFKLCELLKKPYASKLCHAYYGMFSTPEGKIASRKGKQALFEDLLNLAEENVLKTIESRNFSEREKKELATKIGKSAIAFSVLKVDRIKDKVFEVEKATSFDGETAPYIQYTYARTNSILKKARNVFGDIADHADYENLKLGSAFVMVKILNNLKAKVKESFEKKEPSILCREVIELCRNFNKFYAETKVVEEAEVNKSAALIQIVKCVNSALEYAMPIICIDLLESM